MTLRGAVAWYTPLTLRVIITAILLSDVYTMKYFINDLCARTSVVAPRDDDEIIITIAADLLPKFRGVRATVTSCFPSPIVSRTFKSRVHTIRRAMY